MNYYCTENLELLLKHVIPHMYLLKNNNLYATIDNYNILKNIFGETYKIFKLNDNIDNNNKIMTNVNNLFNMDNIIKYKEQKCCAINNIIQNNIPHKFCIIDKYSLDYNVCVNIARFLSLGLGLGLDPEMHIYTISSSNHKILLDNDMKKINKTDNIIEYVDYFKNCSFFVTQCNNLKTLAMHSGCTNIIFIDDSDVSKNNYTKDNNNNNNIFSTNILVTTSNINYNVFSKFLNKDEDNINKIKLFFLPESEKSILFDECKKLTFDYNIKLTKDSLSEQWKIINECASLNTGTLYVIFNTNVLFCDDFESELIDSLNYLVDPDFDICYLYSESENKVDNKNRIAEQNSNIFKNSVYIITNKYAKYIVDNYNVNSFIEKFKIKTSDNDVKKYQLFMNNIRFYNKGLLMNGIGDFIITDYHYDLSLYKTLYLITDRTKETSEIISLLEYRNDYFIQHDTQKEYKLFNFMNMQNLLSSNKISNELREDVRYCVDFSAFKVFPDLIAIKDPNLYNLKMNVRKCKCHSYKSGSLLIDQNKKLSDISKFKLPNKYIVISPGSTNTGYNCHLCKIHHKVSCPKTGNQRNYIDLDWQNTISLLRNNFNCKGIIVGGRIEIPEYIKKMDLFVNLVGKTTINEALEIVKKSHGYIGVDTYNACLSSKLYKNNIIKSTHLGLDWMPHYYHNTLGNVIKMHYNIPIRI